MGSSQSVERNQTNMMHFTSVLTALTFLSCYLANSVSAAEDSACPLSQPCTAASSCPWFQQKMQERASFDRGTREYNKIRDLLIQSICNKKEKKVCCPTDTPPNSEGCSVPDESDQDAAGVVCSVEEVYDPIEGFVCKTSCQQATGFGWVGGSFKTPRNCRRGYVWNIRRGRCTRSRNRG